MKRRTFVTALVWWLLLLLLFPPGGMDIMIYRHNADLTMAGQPAFGRPLVDGLVYGTDATDPRYLDYTGLQHTVYLALTAFNAYSAYTLALMLAGMWLLSRFNCRAALMLAFLPPFAYNMVALNWTDKLPFIVLPLLVLWLVRGLTPLPSSSEPSVR